LRISLESPAVFYILTKNFLEENAQLKNTIKRLEAAQFISDYNNLHVQQQQQQKSSFSSTLFKKL